MEQKLLVQQNYSFTGKQWNNNKKKQSLVSSAVSTIQDHTGVLDNFVMTSTVKKFQENDCAKAPLDGKKVRKLKDKKKKSQLKVGIIAPVL